MIRDCQYFPCHEGLKDCTFCYCPLYPCKDESLGGYWKEVETGKLWACEKCIFPHLSENIENLHNK